MIVQNVMKLLWHSAFFVEQYLYRNGIFLKIAVTFFGIETSLYVSLLLYDGLSEKCK